jgi:hypothetical protein
MRPDNRACIHIRTDKTPDNSSTVPLRSGKLSGMPAANLLSAKAVRAAIKSAKMATKPATISDGEGLSPICQPDGGGWWRLRYWSASRENRLSVGTYPEVSLADARKRRDDARKLIASGVDPSEERKPDAAHLSRDLAAQFALLHLHAVRASLPARYALEPVRATTRAIEEEEALRLQRQYNDARASKESERKSSI